jgi:hypothetical protein
MLVSHQATHEYQCLVRIRLPRTTNACFASGYS